jgi:two-component sensor histidine kinase
MKCDISRAFDGTQMSREAAEDIVLSELSHRWCNGLQIITANIRGMSRECETSAVARRLNLLCDQVHAQAALHRRLSAPPPSAELERYCRALCLDLLLAFGRTEITPWVSVTEVVLSTYRTQVLGLLVTELMTNALKHGRAPEAGGVVSVALEWAGEDLQLIFADNFAPPDAAGGTAPRIVAALAQILGGTLTIETAPGYLTRIRFPPQ